MKTIAKATRADGEEFKVAAEYQCTNPFTGRRYFIWHVFKRGRDYCGQAQWWEEKGFLYKACAMRYFNQLLARKEK